MTRRDLFRTLPLLPATLLVHPRSAAAMDINKMQAVATAITNAGYDATIAKQADGSWKVRAKAAGLVIPVADAAGLAVSQSVTGLIAEIEYS